MHFTNQPVSNPVFFMSKIKMRLEVEPELGRDTKISSHAQGSVSRNAPVPVNDFIDSPGRHTDVLCQPVLRNTHWFQKFLHKHFARMDGQYFLLSHVNSPSDSQRFRRHRHYRHAIENKCAIGHLSVCCVVPICYRSTLPAGFQAACEAIEDPSPHQSSRAYAWLSAEYHAAVYAHTPD